MSNQSEKDIGYTARVLERLLHKYQRERSLHPAQFPYRMEKFHAETECQFGVAEQLERLLKRFHAETDCGKDGFHWVECEAAFSELQEIDPKRAEAVEGFLKEHTRSSQIGEPRE